MFQLPKRKPVNAQDMIRVSHCQGKHLDGLFVEDSLWYLKSPEFVAAYLKPLSDIINHIGLPCLDVGCAEGWACERLKVQYTGIDGSQLAIDKAKKKYRNKTFHLARIEDPVLPEPHDFGTILMGGIFSINVRPEFHYDFMKIYMERFQPKYIIIYELIRVGTKHLENKPDIALVHYQEGDAGISKDRLRKQFLNKRKIMVFECLY